MEGRQFQDEVGDEFGKDIEGRQQGWKNPCPRWPIIPQYHGLIRTQSPATRSDVSYLFHRARCDSLDGSLTIKFWSVRQSRVNALVIKQGSQTDPNADLTWMSTVFSRRCAWKPMQNLREE